MVFTNEEGTSFHRWLLGSRAIAGLWEPEDFAAVADDGVTLTDTLPNIGGNISRIEAARRRPEEFACYFELHIEQGPTLHRGGFPIGVVTGITGRSVYHVDIVGEANHAGTTPMALRRDAMSAAAQIALAVRRIAGEMEVCRVGTVGSMDVHPNAGNVIRPAACRWVWSFATSGWNRWPPPRWSCAAPQRKWATPSRWQSP